MRSNDSHIYVLDDEASSKILVKSEARNLQATSEETMARADDEPQEAAENWQSLLFEESAASVIDASAVENKEIRDEPDLLEVDPLPIASSPGDIQPSPLDMLLDSFPKDDGLKSSALKTSEDDPFAPKPAGASAFEVCIPTVTRGKKSKHDEDMDPLWIYQLVTKRQWAAASVYVAKHPIVASVPLAGGSTILSSCTQGGNLVLHEACKNDPPTGFVRQLLKVNPAAVRVKGQWGYLPLHYACCSGASVDVIKVLIADNPESLYELEDCDSMLPLHLACKSGAPPEVVLELLIHHPQASYAQDMHNMTPRDHAARVAVDFVREAVLSVLDDDSDKLCATAAAARCSLQREQRRTDAFLSSCDAAVERDALVPAAAPSTVFQQEDLADKMKQYCTRILSLELTVDDQKRHYEALLASEREKVANLEVALVEEKHASDSERILHDESRKKMGVLLSSLSNVSGWLCELQGKGKEFIMEIDRSPSNQSDAKEECRSGKNGNDEIEDFNFSTFREGSSVSELVGGTQSESSLDSASSQVPCQE